MYKSDYRRTVFVFALKILLLLPVRDRLLHEIIAMTLNIFTSILRTQCFNYVQT